MPWTSIDKENKCSYNDVVRFVYAISVQTHGFVVLFALNCLVQVH